MVRKNEIRQAEVALTSAPAPTDAGLVFIGRVHTPWTSRMQGRIRHPAPSSCRQIEATLHHTDAAPADIDGACRAGILEHAHEKQAWPTHFKTLHKAQGHLTVGSVREFRQ
jgi:hypothetical protein